jgi:Major Facilitator Superfamily
MTPRASTTGIFLVNGAVIGSLVAQIPWLQERFGLSSGAVGLVLLGMSAGVVLALPLAGQAIERFGSARVTRVGGIAACLLLPLPLLAPHPGLTAVALFALGAASATMDAAMNSHGVAVEERLGRPIMSSLHAGWAVGGIVGAGAGALAAAVGLDPRLTVSVSALALVVLLAGCLRTMGPGHRGTGAGTPRWPRLSWGVVAPAVVCFLVMITEGAMADWGGLYLRQDLGATAGVAALAYACFAAGMAGGRLVGDALNRRFGALALVRGGAALTAGALGTLLLADATWVALPGMALVGLGVANGVPLMFSAAGRLDDTATGPGIAAVSAMGSLGFLAGPPLIGFLAEAVSLPWALAVLCPAAVAVLALAPRAVR